MTNVGKMCAVLAISVGVAGLVGCAPTGAVTHDQAWSDRMTSVLRDSTGQGGSGGELMAMAATGSVALGSVAIGLYDVLGVCKHADRVHLTVSLPHGVTTGSSPDGVLASADIVCGATLKLPVTIPAGGVVLTGSSAGSSGTWYAAIVSPGWFPTTSTSPH